MKRFVTLLFLGGILCVMAILAFDSLKATTAIPAAPLMVIITPTTTVLNGPVILEAIQNHAQFETVSIVVANDREITRVWGLQGLCREKVTYLGYFLVTAGVDLQNLSAADIVVEHGATPQQNAITITVPPARVLHVELDTVHSRVVHHEQSIISQLCGTQLPEMVTEAQAATELMATNTAVEEDLLNLAQDRAGFELQKMLLLFGFNNATIRFQQQFTDDQ